MQHGNQNGGGDMERAFWFVQAKGVIVDIGI